MIKLEKITAIQTELDLIAKWRNQSLIGLRANEQTLKGDSQINWVNSFKDNERYYFIYNKNKPTTFFGYCGLDKIDFIHRTAEMSLLINPKLHKKGYGTVAVKELLKLAFTGFNLNCIFIEVISTTTNWDFWSKQGFKHEGFLQQRYYKNGKYFGSNIGSILKSDWEKSNGC